MESEELKQQKTYPFNESFQLFISKILNNYLRIGVRFQNMPKLTLNLNL